MRYYVHGAGRSGRDAWPAQATDVAVFADHSTARSAADKALLVAEQAPRIPYVLVAHSLGAVVTVLALRDHRLSPSRLVLAEPALYDIARGTAAIEAHVQPMSRARAKAAAGDLFSYWQIVKPMMFHDSATKDTWAEEREFAAQFAALDPPWGHGIDTSFVGKVPTLVVTGGWNDEYESIATVLARSGASTAVVEGSGHRVQDHPDFGAIVEEFLTRTRP